MAALKKSLLGTVFLESRPKKTRQGSGQHTKYAASSRNKARKRYRGQGR
jgi:hypothetical protein